MNRFLTFTLLLFFETPGDGGGGTPEYEVDLGDGGAPGGQPPAPGTPAARVPAQPGRPAPAPPLSGQPAAPGARQPGQPPETIEYARFQEVNDERQQLRQELAEANRRLQRLRVLDGAPDPEAPRSSPFRQHLASLKPEDRSVIEYMDTVTGGAFSEVMELREQLKDALQTVNGLRGSETQRYSTLGKQTWQAFDAGVKELYGGQLEAPAQKILDLSFAYWMRGDPAIAQRYLDGDHQNLVKEFLDLYKRGLIQPGARALGAPPQNPGQFRRAAVPRGGPGRQVVGHRPEQPDPTSPDAVHAAAADAAFAGR